MKQRILVTLAALFALVNWAWAVYVIVWCLIPGKNPDGTSMGDDQSAMMGMLMAVCMNVTIAALVTSWVLRQRRKK